jgi:putative phosphoesterase
VKIGVISDTHLRGYDERLKRILEEPFQGADLILHAGDLTDLAVLDIFEGKEVRAVYGNADPPAVRHLLPDRQLLEVKGFRLLLNHLSGPASVPDETMQEKYGKVDCLIFGHTHRPFVQVEGGVLCFNPGSATGNRFSTVNTVGILDIGQTIRARIVDLAD